MKVPLKIFLSRAWKPKDQSLSGCNAMSTGKEFVDFSEPSPFFRLPVEVV